MQVESENESTASPCRRTEGRQSVETHWHSRETHPLNVLSTFQIGYPSHQRDSAWNEISR